MSYKAIDIVINFTMLLENMHDEVKFGYIYIAIAIHSS